MPQLAVIADLFIPVIGLFWVVRLWRGRPAWRRQMFRRLSVVLTGVYGVYFIDQRLSLWPAIGWDYSTHMALWAGLAFALPASRRWRPLSLTGTVLYAVLMMHLQYHTAADLISTLCALVIIWGLWRVFHRPGSATVESPTTKDSV